MTPQTMDFRAGYEAGKRDAIDRCRMERCHNVPMTARDREHNLAIAFCVEAIVALDVRHALPVKDATDAD